MAKMHPEDIEDREKATDGEKRLFRFLKQAARPHGDYICWYKPSIKSQGMKPDFILFSKKLGLLILEVKDWTCDQIISYTPHRFTIRVSGRAEKKTNPNRQAKRYVNALTKKLKGIPDFSSDLPAHESGLNIPIGRMVVFPNISRKEYHNRGFKWLIPPETTMLKDDLEVEGEIPGDTSGNKFFEKISDSFPFRFKDFNQKALEKLCFILQPQTEIDLPPRPGFGKTRFHQGVFALDEAQARLALRLGSGHQIIKGPPGSGKTLILVHRCNQLFRLNPHVKNILFLCYNITLVGYLKKLLREKGLGVGRPGIQVCHFFKLCARILEEPVHYENEDTEYYDFITGATLDKVTKRGCSDSFDAILIDEGQDFNNEMFKIVLGLLRPGGDLVVALDPYQDLYNRRASWKSLGIKAGGRRTVYLKKGYRNTVEIFDFNQRFIGETPKIEKQMALLLKDYAFHGEMPELRRYGNSDEIEQFLIEDVIELCHRGEYKRSQIAIIYDDKVYGPKRFAYDNRALPMRILNKLESSDVPTTWVSQDAESKEMYDITTDRVSLISIHSSKGLDFDLVYLVGLDHLHHADQTHKKLLSLIYVAMTRARHRLVIPYVEESELIRRMKRCLPK